MSLAALLATLNQPGVAHAIQHCRPMTHPAGWVGQREEIHNHLIVYIERGDLWGCFDGHERELPTGCAFWIPPGVDRQLTVLRGGGSVNDWRFRFALTHENDRLGLKTGVVVRADGGALLPYFQLLREALETPAHREERPFLLRGLLHRFASLPALRMQDAHRLNVTQRRRVETLIQHGLLDRLRPADLADSLGMSLDYLTRRFKKTYGIPPRRYLLCKRMEFAGEVLRDSAMSVKELCAMMHEPHESTFCRQFKVVTGRTPSQYRASGLP